MPELTPVELRNGIWYKREDLYRLEPWGVNGSKLRACRHLMQRAYEAGAMSVVSAASVKSPQSAMAAVLAREIGLECEVIVGATTPEKAIKNHQAIRMAHEAGASIRAIAVAYNTALQKASSDAALVPGVWRLPYGITTPVGAPLEDVRAFVEVGAAQVANLPDEVERLVVPFGSANTATGVLYGLHDHRPAALREVVLVEIGPSRREWCADRLERLGRPFMPKGVNLRYITLHDVFANYSDLMPETLDGITFHPTYEGKIIRFLNLTEPAWWTARDGKTCFWIVGGPIG